MPDDLHDSDHLANSVKKRSLRLGRSKRSAGESDLQRVCAMGGSAAGVQFVR